MDESMEHDIETCPVIQCRDCRSTRRVHYLALADEEVAKPENRWYLTLHPQAMSPVVCAKLSQETPKRSRSVAPMDEVNEDCFVLCQPVSEYVSEEDDIFSCSSDDSDSDSDYEDESE
jgi:hypothetical protein